MEAELLALVTAAAAELAAAAPTDRWHGARNEFADLLLSGAPGSTDREALTAELDEARAELLAATEDGDADEVVAAVTHEWRRRIHRLLSESPDMAERVRALLDGLRPYGGPSGGVVFGQFGGTQYDRIYQAGRDQVIHPAAGNTPPGPPFGGDEEDEW
ncbi:hypothetical protein [Streptomyces sp. NPDC053427]|uniref:hypothetical protein n=1 Tax=Streptomyces sp. NPDC053427 TaxID=3365701 RepID=UPI0037D8FB81